MSGVCFFGCMETTTKTNEKRREENSSREERFFLIANSHLNFFIRKNETYI